MTDGTSQDPLQGVTLQAMLEDLIARHGWPELARLVPLRCFANEPSVSSSLAFLRKTAWARAKVERRYVADQRLRERNAKRNRRRAAMRAHRAEQDQAPGHGTPDLDP